MRCFKFLQLVILMTPVLPLVERSILVVRCRTMGLLKWYVQFVPLMLYYSLDCHGSNAASQVGFCAEQHWQMGHSIHRG